MEYRIRLHRHSTKKRPFFYIVIADAAARKDGTFIAKIGTYNMAVRPAVLQVDNEDAIKWLQQGASMSATARQLLSSKGVLYLKHVRRGVNMGLFDQDTAHLLFEKWMQVREAVEIKKQQLLQQKRHQQQKRRGLPHRKPAAGRSDSRNKDQFPANRKLTPVNRNFLTNRRSDPPNQ
jgi:small subunit ribosomal protein S16